MTTPWRIMPGIPTVTRSAPGSWEASEAMVSTSFVGGSG